MTYRHKYGIGNIEAATFDSLFIPRTVRSGTKPGVILLHPASQAFGTTGFEFYGPAFPDAHKLIYQLAKEGIPSITGYMGGNGFANDGQSGSAGTSLINKALAYMAAQVSGISSTRAHVFGFSMGGGDALRWASLNQSKAASAAGVMPMASLIRLFRENTGFNGGANSVAYGIAQAWALTARNVSDVVTTSGSPTITSATANFTSADNGRYITRGVSQTAIPVDTTLTFVNSTTATMSKNATASTTGQVVTIADPLPISGTAGADLIGVHAPRLDSSDIPNQWWYASDDAYITPSDVTALAAAAGGTAHNLGATGHDNDALAAAAAWNGGTDWSDYITWIKAHD